MKKYPHLIFLSLVAVFIVLLCVFYELRILSKKVDDMYILVEKTSLESDGLHSAFLEEVPILQNLQKSLT